MLRKVIALITLGSTLLLGLLLVATTPSSAGPLGILAIFTAMYLMALGVLSFLFYGISYLISRVVGSMTKKPARSHLRFREAYYYGSIAALAPVMIIAMQSVSQVGVYQFLLVVFFVIVAWVYITKRTM